METGHRMFEKGRIVSVPGKLVEEDSLFRMCDAERQGQGREERQPQHDSEDAAQLLSLTLGSALGVLC